MSALASCLWVGVGGFFGAISRFLLTRWVAALMGVRFPHGTLVVNVLGSLVLGLVTMLYVRGALPMAEQVRLGIAIGFIGAFTTFSTFALETNALFDDGRWMMAGVNVLGSVALCLLAVRLGYVLGRL